jgi:hypothetical protein
MCTGKIFRRSVRGNNKEFRDELIMKVQAMSATKTWPIATFCRIQKSVQILSDEVGFWVRSPYSANWFIVSCEQLKMITVFSSTKLNFFCGFWLNTLRHAQHTAAKLHTTNVITNRATHHLGEGVKQNAVKIFFFFWLFWSVRPQFSLLSSCSFLTQRRKDWPFFSLHSGEHE